MSTPRWREALGLALVLAAAMVLFQPALTSAFFADDYLFLDQVRARGLLASLLAPDPLSNFLRPVSRQLYFWVVSHASGESPLAFHVTNLALFLVLLGLFFLVARRLAGPWAALIAAGALALHYVADIPVRWACGSQDLLAVAGALAAILFHLQGRRVLAAAALIVGVLSKEVVLLTPLIAVAADRRPEESWRRAAGRAWPLAMALVVWLGLWLAMPQRRSQQATEVEIQVAGPVAAIAHLPQVILGAEWRLGQLGRIPWKAPPLVPLGLVLIALLAAERRAPVGRRERRHGVQVGVLWALFAAAPVAAVAALWSAYYYLFAMFGVTLALGALLASRPRWEALAAVAVLAVGSAGARDLDEFATPRDPWAGRSHINRFYIERATSQTEAYLADLERMHPRFAPNTTLFFTGLKGNVAFLAGDGPLQRWAYSDPTLRAYYLSAFSIDKVQRGPTHYFMASPDTLQELAPGPHLMSDIALALLVSEHPKAASDALALAQQADTASRRLATWGAWTLWAAGEAPAALAALRRAGVQTVAGAEAEIEQALAAVAAGDTSMADRIMSHSVVAHGLDPGAHALLADLRLSRDPEDVDGAIEALAARLLAEDQPTAWRRWAMVQAHRERYLEALHSFERYFDLAGAAGEGDREAQDWTATIRAMVPGGILAAEGQREQRVSLRR